MIFPKKFEKDVRVYTYNDHAIAYICFDHVIEGSEGWFSIAKTEAEAIRKLMRDFDLLITQSSKPVAFKWIVPLEDYGTLQLNGEHNETKTGR